MRDTISTGQAAKLCGVQPDTILKWIKRKKIEASKTAGGHYRIPKEEINPYIIEDQEIITDNSESIHYCWEYHSESETPSESCRSCIIFRSKAEKCYLMAGLGKVAGYTQKYCKNSCYECEYFNFINRTPTNVLIVTEDEELEKDLNINAKENFVLKFCCCGYETSYAIQEFHPDFIFIDQTLKKSSSNEICKHLLTDPRIHGSQIILTSSTKVNDDDLPKGICASIKSPYTTKDLEECINRLKESFFGEQPGIKGL